MAVLALKLAGPFQSWGTNLKLRDHETDTMPSKSGVIGMIAAALGRKRDMDISDLRALRFGVRGDDPGTILRDFQTSHSWKINRTGKEYADAKDSYIGNRYYLQDACFTVCLEGNEELLKKCAQALKHPVFPPYLGRRNCVPDPGLVIGIYDGNLEAVLTTIPPQCERNSSYLRICVETNETGDRMRHDNPMSYDFHNRQYEYRMEKELEIGEENVH